MDNSEISRLVEIVKTGNLEDGMSLGAEGKIIEMSLCLRRVGVVLSMEKKESEFYSRAFKAMAETATNARWGKEIVQLHLPDYASIDKMVELYSEPGCAPDLLMRKKEYVRALARLTYGEY